ncbi:MAG: hypothetical protein S4CHLAM20_01130 [Chlamydiia bacterium]|nr:hypothetical protein [Chlamydiia bacterium]
MRFFFTSCFVLCSLFAKSDDKVFHKTVAQIEAYKEKDTLNLKPGCVRRLTRNLLTPIHKRHISDRLKSDTHIMKKSSSGPLTIKFLLPLSLKREILALLAQNKLTLSIPFPKDSPITTQEVEVDHYVKAPKGLFAMRCQINTTLLSPSEIVFIHLLKTTL